MDDKPICCDRKPLGQDMEPGTYWWCSCGRSATQPFCDGSHKVCSLRPVKVEIIEPGKVWWCQCKATGQAPFCDGSHKALPVAE